MHETNVYRNILGGVSRCFRPPLVDSSARSLIFRHLKMGTSAKRSSPPPYPHFTPAAQCVHFYHHQHTVWYSKTRYNWLKENLVVQYSRQGQYHRPLSYQVAMCILSSYGQRDAQPKLKEMLTIFMSTERTIIDVTVFYAGVLFALSQF